MHFKNLPLPEPLYWCSEGCAVGCLPAVTKRLFAECFYMFLLYPFIKALQDEEPAFFFSAVTWPPFLGGVFLCFRFELMGTSSSKKLERLFCYLREPRFWFLTHRKGELVRLARVLIVEEPHTELTCQKLACNQTGERHRCEQGTSWLKDTLGCKWCKRCPFDVTGQCFVNQKDLARSAGGCEPSWSLTSHQVSGPAEKKNRNQIARFTAKIMARSRPFLDLHLDF